MHRRGLGAPQDDTAAVAWYRRGAELGYDESDLNLADAILSGPSKSNRRFAGYYSRRSDGTLLSVGPLAILASLLVVAAIVFARKRGA
jgi:TPR repeat protein